MKSYKLSLVAVAVSIGASAGDLKKVEESDTLISDNILERIVVTGSRIKEDINEVPASVSIVDSKQIAQDMLTSTELQNMLALHVPGMGPGRGASSNSGQTLRGRNALVMIDGVPQSTPLRNGKLGIRSLDPSVIERIEVTKGATSIYGNGAAGGVINYITKKASGDEFTAKFAVNTSFSTIKFDDTLGHRVDLSVDGTVDKLEYVVSLVRDENGIIRDAGGDALGLMYGLSDFRSDNLFTKFNYYIDDARSLQFTYNYFEGQQESDYITVNNSVNSKIKSYAIENTEGLVIAGDPQGPRGNHNVMLQYQDNDVTDNTEMTVDLYWQKIENVFFYSTKFKDVDLGYAGGQSMITSDKKGARFNFSTLQEFDGFNAVFIYGLDFLNDTTAQPLVDGRMWTPEMDMDNIAGYLQTKLIFDSDLVLKAGVRQEAINIDVNDYKTLMICKDGKACTVSNAVSGGALDYDATTYNIGLRYNYDELFSPYLSYSEGFDIANIGGLLRNAKFSKLEQLDTEASIVENSEFGFSGRYENINYEAAVYYSTNNYGGNMIADELTETYRLERAPQKIWGYEFAVDAKFSDELDAGISYSWVEGKNKDSNEYLDAGSITPPKLTAFLNYQAIENLRFSLNILAMQSRDRFDAVDGAYKGKKGPVTSYEVVNASVRYDIDSAMRLSLGIENLLNEDYYPHISQSHTFTGWNVKGKGRTANLGFSYQF
jgi:iron complex outermembrane recepter protein